MNTEKFQLNQQQVSQPAPKEKEPRRWPFYLLVAVIILLLTISGLLFFTTSTFVVPNFINTESLSKEDLAINGTEDRVIVRQDDLGQLTLLTPQSIGITSSPTFGGLTITNLDGNIKAVKGTFISEALDLSSSTEVMGSLTTINGGTGLNAGPAENQLLVGDGQGGYSLKIIQAGSNISIDNTDSGIVINSTGGSSSSNDVGTVKQINTGNGLTGGPITTTGTISVNAPTCAGNERLSWNGSAFTCGVVGSPDLTDISSNLTPFTDNTYDLGSLSTRWRDLYLGPGSLKITSTTGTSGTGANYTLLESGFTGGTALMRTTNNGTNTSGNFGGLLLSSGINTGQGSNAAINLLATNNLGASDRLFSVSNNNGGNTPLTIAGNGKTALTILSHTGGGFGLDVSSTVNGNTTNSAGAAGIRSIVSVTNPTDYNVRAHYGVMNYAGGVSTGGIYGGSFVANINSGSVGFGVGGLGNIVNGATAERIQAGSFSSTNNGTVNDFQEGMYTGIINNGAVTNQMVGTMNYFVNGAAGVVGDDLKGYWAQMQNLGEATGDYAGVFADLRGESDGIVGGDVIGFWGSVSAGTQTISGSLYGLKLDMDETATSTVDNAYGLYVSSLGSGNLNNYGLYIDATTTEGSNSNYSIYTAGGDSYFTNALRIGNTSSSTAGMLRWTGTDFEGYDGSDWVSFTSGGGGGDDCGSASCFVNGGNAFAGVATIGTTDDNPLRFITNNTEKFRITTDGRISLNNNNPQAYASFHMSLDSNPVIVLEDVGDGVSYLAHDSSNGGVFGSEQNLIFKTGVDFGAGPVASGTQAMHIATDGKVSIGNFTGTTAYLSLAASTSSLASLNFGDGDDPSSAAEGDMWWNGTNLYFNDGSSNVDLLAGGGASQWVDESEGIYYNQGRVHVPNFNGGSITNQEGVRIRLENEGTISAVQYGIESVLIGYDIGTIDTMWAGNFGTANYGTVTNGMIGVRTSLENIDAGSSAYMIGNSIEFNGNGTSNGDVTGLNIEVAANLTVAGNLYGARIQSGTDNTVNNAYGLFIESMSDGATSNYGLYIQEASGGSGINYSLYVAGGGSFLNGDLEVGEGLSIYGASGLYIDIGGMEVWGSSAFQDGVTMYGSLTLDAIQSCGDALITDVDGVVSCLSSDRNIKENINNLGSSSSLDKVLALQGVSYQYKDQAKWGSQTEFGLIAQDVEAVAPEMVFVTGDGVKGVKYSQMTALLIEAMKEQQNQINELDQRVSALENSETLGTSTSGVATITAGSTMVVVNSTEVKTDSKILITPDQFVSYKVVNKVEGVSFTIEISQPSLDDVKFDYLIVK